MSKPRTLVERSERFAERPKLPLHNWLDWVAYAWRMGYLAAERDARRSREFIYGKGDP